MISKRALDLLKKQHIHYLQDKTNNAYKNLSQLEQQKLDQDFRMWLHLHHHAISYLGMTGIYKQIFLTKVLISFEEQKFDKWAEFHGYSAEEIHEINHEINGVE